MSFGAYPGSSKTLFGNSFFLFCKHGELNFKKARAGVASEKEKGEKLLCWFIL